MIGTIVGSYRITSQLSVGGMGTVYRAEHTLIGRLAAVKILHPEMSTNRDIVGRFFNEAKATTTIKHPGIVEVLDFGYMPSGHAYLVMELLEGESLSMRIRARGRMLEGEAAMLMRGVCTALAAAHAKGIVHRDLKPDNIFVVPDPESPTGERTKILDFGIAKLTDIGLASSATKTGAVLGTPTYMSPEQCKGTGEVDHRADLYSIGCMLYELVAGRPPFINTGAGELIGSHLFVQPEPPSRHVAISPELEQLIMMLLDKNPANRVQTARDLAQHLVQLAQHQGYVSATSTDPGQRFSTPSIHQAMNHAMTPAGAPTGHAVFSPTPAPPVPTPGYAQQPPTPYPHTPQHQTPQHVTPHHQAPPHHTPHPQAARHHTPVPTPYPMTTTPTTLSGAASQPHATVDGPRSRTRLVIAIGAGLAFAPAGIIAIVATSSPSSSASGHGAASQPAITDEPAPAPAPPATIPARTPAAVPAVAPPPPTPTPTTPTTPTPTTPTPTTPTPTTPTPTTPAPTTPTPTTPTPTTQTTPTTPTPTTPTPTTPTPKTTPTTPTPTPPTPTPASPPPSTPVITKPAMPAKPTKPARPTKPAKPTRDSELLETDL